MGEVHNLEWRLLNQNAVIIIIIKMKKILTVSFF